MKVKNLFIITLVAVLCTAQIHATVLHTNPFFEGRFEGRNVKFSTTGKTLKVAVSNVQSEAISMLLEDIEGFTLVNETVNAKPNFVKAFRLENLPAGKYFFTVKRNGVKVIQEFDITPVGIVGLSMENREETLLPTMIQKNDKVIISSFVAKGDKTHVRILNNDGVVVFEESYSDEILRKTFDVSNLSGGVYFIEVQTKADSEYFTLVR